MSIIHSHSVNARQESGVTVASAVPLARAALAPAPQLIAVIIEKRRFIRDCLAGALRATSGHEVLAFSSIEEWLAICGHTPASVVLLSGHGLGNGVQLRQTINQLGQAKRYVPTIVVSDVEDMGHVIEALDKGVKGYIPTTLPLDVVVEAMRLVRAGGVFIPASCLTAARGGSVRSGATTALGRMFTARQEAVVAALRQGKANKIIAHELQLQESTVKVHIRNIMKKLKAKNRTEVAYIVGQMAGG